MACVVPHADATVDAAAVRAFLRERLGGYKVPRQGLLLTEEDIALTGSAKIKSSDLRQLAVKRLADSWRHGPAEAFSVRCVQCRADGLAVAPPGDTGHGDTAPTGLHTARARMLYIRGGLPR